MSTQEEREGWLAELTARVTMACTGSDHEHTIQTLTLLKDACNELKALALNEETPPFVLEHLARCGILIATASALVSGILTQKGEDE